MKKLNAAGLVLFNSGYVYRMLRKEAGRIGVSWRQITLLKDIELQSPVTQKELANINHMSGPSISIIVNEMIGQGLVSRTTNPLDKRSSTLDLTAKGRRRLQTDGEKMQACLIPVLAKLSASEVQTVIDAESALARALTQ